MLRRTTAQFVFVGNMGIKFGRDHPVESKEFETYCQWLKQNRKLQRYYGMGGFRVDIDNCYFYKQDFGRRPRFHITRYSSGKKWEHRDEQAKKWKIKIRRGPYDLQAGSAQWGGNQAWLPIHMYLNSPQTQWARSQKRGGNFMTKDQAIDLVEKWGVGSMTVDEDMWRVEADEKRYFRHPLYSDNFPWLTAPKENDEPDFSWKRDDKMDYTGNDKDARNTFRSLWAENVPAKVLA